MSKKFRKCQPVRLTKDEPWRILSFMGEREQFEFVKLPRKWKTTSAIEQLYEGTRWYVERGPITHFRHWHGELRDVYKGNLIPFSWVPDFVGVSRAALHKRARAGGLTVFTFIVTENSQTFLGGVRARDTRRRYDYAVISECEAWRELLMEWAAQQELKQEAE